MESQGYINNKIRYRVTIHFTLYFVVAPMVFFRMKVFTVVRIGKEVGKSSISIVAYGNHDIS